MAFRRHSIYYASGIWVACIHNYDNNGGLYYSTDGKTWTQSNVNNIGFYEAYNANGIWVACGSNSSNTGKGIYYSVTWEPSE